MVEEYCRVGYNTALSGMRGSIVRIVIDISVLFLFGAVAGWIIELVFRRFFSHKRWVNPGFLDGPYLPIYGVSVVVFYFISDFALDVWVQLLLYAFVPTLFELVTGLFFIRVYHIRLWDYSDRKWNVDGVVCPTFTLLWILLGLFFKYVVYEFTSSLLAYVQGHQQLLLFIGIYYGIFLVDLFTAFNAASQIRRLLTETEERFQVNYERLKLDVRTWLNEKRAKFGLSRYLFPFVGRGRNGLIWVISRELERIREGNLKNRGAQTIRKLIRGRKDE
jgi:uncharacterized membrane protein